jgi:WD40 repeat protein
MLIKHWKNFAGIEMIDVLRLTAMILFGLASLAVAQAQPNSFPVPSPSDVPSTVDLVSLEPLDAAANYPPVVTALAATKDGQWLVAAGDDHALRVVQLTDGRIYKTRRGHTDWVRALVVDESRRLVLSCGNDGSVRLWKHDEPDSIKGEVLHQAEFALSSMAISDDGHWLAWGGFGATIQIFSLEARSIVRTLTNPCCDVRALTFSHDGKQLAVGGRDGCLRVWTWELEQSPLEQHLHRDRIHSLSFSADDETLTSIGEDRRLINYRYRTGQVVLDRKLSSGRLLSMSLIDDRTVALAGSDNTIRILDLQTGDELNRLIGHEGSVAIMIRNSRQLISGSYDTTIRFWDFDEARRRRATSAGRYEHPVSARFPDSGLAESIR